MYLLVFNSSNSQRLCAHQLDRMMYTIELTFCPCTSNVRLNSTFISFFFLFQLLISLSILFHCFCFSSIVFFFFFCCSIRIFLFRRLAQYQRSGVKAPFNGWTQPAEPRKSLQRLGDTCARVRGRPSEVSKNYIRVEKF